MILTGAAASAADERSPRKQKLDARADRGPSGDTIPKEYEHRGKELQPLTRHDQPHEWLGLLPRAMLYSMVQEFRDDAWRRLGMRRLGDRYCMA